MDFIVARYGTFVLLRPPVQGNTLLLWLAPLGLLLAAVLGFRRLFAGAAAPAVVTADAVLTPDEAKRVEVLLGDHPQR